MKHLRIAWLGPVPTESGAVAGVATVLISHLSSLGHEIDCYFPDAVGVLPPPIADEPRVKVVWAGTRWDWGKWYSKNPTGAFVTSLGARCWAFRRLRRQMTRRHAAAAYDVVYQFSNIEVVGVPRRLRQSVPLVIHPETHMAGELRWYRAERTLTKACEPDRLRRIVVLTMLIVRTAVQRRTIRWADAVVCISAVFRDELILDYGIDPHRAIVVPNPIDLEVFSASARPASDPPVALVLGRVSARKGVNQIVALSHALPDAGVNVAIRIVGGHTLWSDYRPLLRGAKAHNTTYVGPVSAIGAKAELAAADLLIQASQYEPFGLTVGEALATGVPVVATAAVGAVEGTSRRCTEVVPVGDEGALVRAVESSLKRLQQDPLQVRTLARADAERLFDPRMIARRLSDLLSNVVSMSDGPLTSATGSGEVSTLDVVVPSYMRPHLLDRCLSSLVQQTIRPERIVVVARREDRATQQVIGNWAARVANIVVVLVDEPGVIAAMTRGIAATTADVIAFTDDDAAPRSDWIARIIEHFEIRSVGGVGGRDIVAGQKGPLTTDVGRRRWYGRVVGNHHLGYGPPRPVEVLKGVNMAFRAEALAMPRADVLRGTGAQVHFELLVSGHARQHGWRLIYDPAIVVDHEVGNRTGADVRWKPRPGAIRDAAYNGSLATASLRGRAGNWQALYGLAVGSKGEPGLGRFAIAVARMEREVIRRSPASLVGHVGAIRRFARGVDLDNLMITATVLRSCPESEMSRNGFAPRTSL